MYLQNEQTSKWLLATSFMFVRGAACLSYGAASISITLFNKAVFAIFQFNYPNIVTTLQILVSIMYMVLLKEARLVDFGRLSWRTVRQVAPLALCWWIYVVSGVTALRYLTVPMYSVFRRTTTLLTVVGEWLMFGKVPTPAAVVAILIMLTGATIAGATDLSFSLPGYIFVTICVVSTAAYLLLIRSLKDKSGNLFFSVSQAFLLNLAIFWCTTANSPVATTVTGQMKDFITTAAGMFLFGDHQFELRNFLGVCIGLLGGSLYAYLGLAATTKKVVNKV